MKEAAGYLAYASLFTHMAQRSGDKPLLAAVDEVRCLDCGQVYAKPAGGGTVRANPGCPRCGYVGWAEVASLTEALRRSLRERTLEQRHSLLGTW